MKTETTAPKKPSASDTRPLTSTRRRRSRPRSSVPKRCAESRSIGAERLSKSASSAPKGKKNGLTKQAKAMKRRTKLLTTARSEERRVGKECRSRWSPYEYKKKKQHFYHELTQKYRERKNRITSQADH